MAQKKWSNPKKKKTIHATKIFYKGKWIKGYSVPSEIKKIIKRGKKYED